MTDEELLSFRVMGQLTQEEDLLLVLIGTGGVGPLEKLQSVSPDRAEQMSALHSAAITFLPRRVLSLSVTGAHRQTHTSSTMSQLRQGT